MSQGLRNGGPNCESIAASHSKATGVLGPTPFEGLGYVDRALTFTIDIMHISGNICRDALNMITGSSKFTGTLLASLKEFDMRPDIVANIERDGLVANPYSWSKVTRGRVRQLMHATKFPGAWLRDHTNIGALAEKTDRLIGMKTHSYHVSLESGLLAELANYPRGTSV